MFGRDGDIAFSTVQEEIALKLSLSPMFSLSGLRIPREQSTLARGQKINANFFCTEFFENPSGHGRPHRKSWKSAPKSAFFCGPGDGENFVTQGRPGVRVRNVRGKSGPKSLCLCCFFLP